MSKFCPDCWFKINIEPCEINVIDTEIINEDNIKNIYCQECGTANENYAKFCGGCGNSLTDSWWKDICDNSLISSVEIEWNSDLAQEGQVNKSAPIINRLIYVIVFLGVIFLIRFILFIAMDYMLKSTGPIEKPFVAILIVALIVIAFVYSIFSRIWSLIKSFKK